MSTLRASAKRDDSAAVGRFGVGFAAVVAVSDEPSIASASGGVQWSAERARELVREIPGLAEELTRRNGQVPLLRLPFEIDPPELPEGFATVVRLPLRDDAAVQQVRRQLDEVGPALLLALPALESIEIDVDGVTRTVSLADGEWHTAEAHGDVPAELLADRPTEERARSTWQVRWTLPLPDGTPAVLHAPTPSDERLDLPALLIASFPLAPDRRHVAPGPLTDFLIERAAETYVRLLSELPAAPAVLDLVPAGIAAGELDARLRRAIMALLPEAPLLPGRLRGRDATVVDAPAAFVEYLGDVLPGLVPPAWPARHPALTALGVRRMELADVVDALAALDREPAWWHGLYDALGAASIEGLGALPVPLASDRLVRGPRGLLIADEIDPAPLEPLGLRFVHPEAVHPLLSRLGALDAGPRAILADPAVRAAAEDSFDADDPAEIAEAVLGLVAAAHLDPGDEPWLAELALPGADGELYAAGELLLPGSPLREIMADDAPFGVVPGDLLERWGADALTAAGVLDGFALVRGEDVDLTGLADQAESFHLDDEDRWAEEVLDRLGMQELPPLLPEFQAVRDLELVADWPAALRLLAEPPLRAAVVEPAYASLHGGRRAAVPSYTAWWLRRHPILDGRHPAEFRLPGEDDLLAGLYDPAPEGLDEQLLLALGVRTSLDGLLREPGGAAELLDRLGDPGRAVTRERLGALWTALAETPDLRLDPPARVRAIVDGVVEVVDAADALVLDRPDLLPLLTGQPLVIPAHGTAEHLAELLDLPLASEEVAGAVETAGEKRPVPDIVRAVLPGAPENYTAYESLVVDGVPVTWWCGGGEPHAAGAAGLARALAWTCGAWPDRLLAEAVLRDPGRLPDLLAEADLE
ncbi:hypothetical protein ACRB68_79650 [Actinomadura sp. RB68]|uniref:Molecular chaperone Hsp90 n=1 Tax=Actinomadura macrotermitis TaxID=2585200 RepID=A0A7K0C8X2_9ACTN|nr:hypothetical protein [Actinomadura macrotermitis]MQY09836.1 hypothetical protein [Actinomadura macrotermitis]